MPNDDRQSPSLDDQFRWKRELEISRYLASQDSGGFFPGPGAAAAEDLFDGNSETGGSDDSLANRGIRAAGKGVSAAGSGVKATGSGVEYAGKGLEYAGKGTELAGKGAEMAGKGMQAAGDAGIQGGQAMTDAGVALSSTGLGAIAGVPLAAVGGATMLGGAGLKAGGQGTEAAGKGAQQVGKGMQKGGSGMQKAGGMMQNAGDMLKNGGGLVSGLGEGKNTQLDADGRPVSPTGGAMDTMGLKEKLTPQSMSGAGKMPGSRVQQAFQQGGDATDRTLRMGAAVGGEAAEATGKAMGPQGEAFGKAVADGIGGGAEMAIAGKDLLKGDIASAGVGLKKAIDTYVWPATADLVTGTGIAALTTLQLYWIASLLSFRGTVKMKLWEHVVLASLTIIELLLIVAILSLLMVGLCMNYPVCALDVGRAVGADTLQALIGI